MLFGVGSGVISFAGITVPLEYTQLASNHISSHNDRIYFAFSGIVSALQYMTYSELPVTDTLKGTFTPQIVEL